MDLNNETRRQHYVSQTEQKLNASIGENIYEFYLIKEGESVRLSEPVPRLIEKNLHLLDLFSFDVEPKAKLRENFEALFRQYEDSLAELTINLLQKANDSKAITNDELERLFAAKLMGFVRNPYSVQKVLNTFTPFLHVVPLDPKLKCLHDRVLNGRKPQQKYICEQLGISTDMYRDWLTVLFMLLVKVPTEETNFLNLITHSVFQSKAIFLGTMICTYSTECAILSDRAGILSNLEDSEIYEFNLSKSAFVRYQFFHKDDLLRDISTSSTNKNKYADHIKMQRTPIFLRLEHDNVELLRAYNANAIAHSYERVFGASKTPMY